jgi:hypothetical protein
MSAITQRVMDARNALASAQGAQSVAHDELANILAYGVALEQRIAHALQLLGPLTECLVEEHHGELADMAEAIDAALRGRASVARVDRTPDPCRHDYLGLSLSAEVKDFMQR